MGFHGVVAYIRPAIGFHLTCSSVVGRAVTDITLRGLQRVERLRLQESGVIFNWKG